MMSPNSMGEDRGGSPHFRHLVSLCNVSLFDSDWSFSATLIFSCLVPSSILFLALQKTWKGWPLANQQVVPSIINGVITAFYYILWGKGLKSCGPVRAILAEYSGAVLGLLSAALYGRRSHLWKKMGGLIAMLASFFLVSQGWAMARYSPFSFIDSLEGQDQTEQVLGVTEMLIPISAGILSALRRVIARWVSLKNHLKRRLNAITITSGTCFLFPMAMWDFIITAYGVLFSKTLMVAGGCIIILEIVYKMNFSLLGF